MDLLLFDLHNSSTTPRGHRSSAEPGSCPLGLQTGFLWKIVSNGRVNEDLMILNDGDAGGDDDDDDDDSGGILYYICYLLAAP